MHKRILIYTNLYPIILLKIQSKYVIESNENQNILLRNFTLTRKNMYLQK